ncbi:MAG: CBS domain-containing protein [Anaerolineae bacterium]|nr:CBS domain-containing protein [Anaerolineae bacterium]
MTVRDLLRIKGADVWSVTPSTNLLDMLRMLGEKDVGALVVMEDEKLVGIISERDFARLIGKSGCVPLNGQVEMIMTREVFHVDPSQTIEQVMQLMSAKHIRHLPVIEDGKLAGLISIGDVVKAIISDQQSLIRNLEDYIEGSGYVR